MHCISLSALYFVHSTILHISHLVFALCFSNCPACSGIDSKRQFLLISWTRICVFTTEASQSGHVGSDNTVPVHRTDFCVLCTMCFHITSAMNLVQCTMCFHSYNYHDVHCTVHNMSSMCKSAVRSLKRCNALYTPSAQQNSKKTVHNTSRSGHVGHWSVVWVGQKKCVSPFRFSAEIRFLRPLSCLECYSLQMQFKF